MMSRHLPAWIAALHACACLGLHGQTPPAAAPAEPEALVTLRTAFLRQVMADSQLLTEQYERALAKAEAEVAASGDYEEARAIRQRREQLKALYTGTASSLATPLLDRVIVGAGLLVWFMPALAAIAQAVRALTTGRIHFVRPPRDYLLATDPIAFWQGVGFWLIIAALAGFLAWRYWQPKLFPVETATREG